MKSSRIESIQCPQCGSTKNIQVGKQIYQCRNCDTQYVLDDNEVTINHYHHQVPTQSKPQALVAIGVAVAAAMLLLLFVWLKPEAAPVEMGERWQRYDSYFLEAPNAQAVVVRVGLMQEGGRKSEQEDHAVKVVTYDAASGKRLAVQTLPLDMPRLTRVDFKYFADGKLYFIVENKAVGKITPATMQAQLLPLNHMAQHPQLASGIANADYESGWQNSGLRLLTNEGSKWVYFPVTDRLLSQDAYQNLEANTEAGGKTAVGFRFLNTERFGTDDKNQLVRYTYVTHTGEPVLEPSFDFDDAGKLTIKPWSQQQAQVEDFAMFTPERSYFNGHLLALNDKVLLIAFKMNPANDTLYTIQALDAHTGAVRWTYHVDDDSKMYYPASGLILANEQGYFVDFGREVVLFDANGQVVMEK